jgi:hypothetical protein
MTVDLFGGRILLKITAASRELLPEDKTHDCTPKNKIRFRSPPVNVARLGKGPSSGSSYAMINGVILASSLEPNVRGVKTIIIS